MDITLGFGPSILGSNPDGSARWRGWVAQLAEHGTHNAKVVGSIPTPATTINAPIAQLVEQIPLKDKVGGSIPPGRTLTRQNLVKLKFWASGGIGIRARLKIVFLRD